MATTIALGTGIVSLIFGILILAFPKFLRYFVGIYFIVIGALQLLS
ncbi:DUF3096 domain-containing protein [Candidatus Pacearchaeota archaeon]|nr:DUF3096 domain-containing protein [Candidatus Pacearchaeota archaeon]